MLLEENNYFYWKREIKIIISDLDNTLVSSKRKITKYTINTLKELKKRKIIFVIATAKSRQSAHKNMNILKPDFIIESGGALCIHNQKTIYRSILTQKEAKQIIDFIYSNLKRPKFTIESDNGYFSNFELKDPDFKHQKYFNSKSEIESDVYKISLKTSNKPFVRELKIKFANLSIINFSNSNWYRIANPKATKWNAINALLDFLNLDPNQSCTFGDDINDLEMIKNAKIGVAVGNSIDLVKCSANYITERCDKDGVAKFINKYFLTL